MVESNPPAPSDCSRTLVIPLPVARYVSGELIFELYDGGQPCPAASFRSVGRDSCQRKKTSQGQRDPKRFCGHTKIVPAFQDPPEADFQLIAK